MVGGIPQPEKSARLRFMAQTFISHSTCKRCGAKQTTRVRVKTVAKNSSSDTIKEILEVAGVAAPLVTKVVRDLVSKGK